MRRNEQSPPLGEFEQVVLLALVRLGPDAYGATIRREIETRTGRDLAISAVYVTLDRLETKGLVRSRVGEPTPQRGGRRRKHFVLLPAGRRAITQACRAFGVMAEGLGLI
jgi:DNA-binding PadR family transcriptional regulator